MYCGANASCCGRVELGALFVLVERAHATLNPAGLAMVMVSRTLADYLSGKKARIPGRPLGQVGLGTAVWVLGFSVALKYTVWGQRIVPVIVTGNLLMLSHQSPWQVTPGAGVVFGAAIAVPAPTTVAPIARATDTNPTTTVRFWFMPVIVRTTRGTGPRNDPPPASTHGHQPTPNT
jgi:hypothetical protein